jgi:predicted SAM-dependent methyltransferase
MSKSKIKKPGEHNIRTLGPPTLPMAASTVSLKIDLGCGQNPREGFEGADRVAGPTVKHVVNLFRYPWPWADNSIEQLNASHFIEHIPDVEVEADGTTAEWGEGQDALLRFFDECYRVLIPDGWLFLQWPSLRSNRAFQDPTHRRFIPEATMGYLDRDWRVSQKLDHYNVKCHFKAFDVGHTYDSSIHARHDQVRERFVQNYWNGSIDFCAKLKAIK